MMADRYTLCACIFFSSALATIPSRPPYPGTWTALEDFSDEFNDGFNASRWMNQSPDGWRGRLPGLFAPSNVIVANGSLQLWARHENITDPALKKMGYANFTTSAMASQNVVRYGYFEIESRAGSSKVSSSFWFFQSEPTVWTEIDVFELTGEHGSTTLRTQDSMHTHVFRLPNTTSSELPGLCKCTLPSSSMPRDTGRNVEDAVSCSQANYTHRSTPYSSDFHVFGLLWTPNIIEFTVDGVLQWSVPNTCMHQPLRLNFDRETMPGWFGLPDPANLPDTPFTINYVRSWAQVEWDYM